MRSARRDLWLCSPRTQEIASTTLDLPHPFGPTMQVVPVPLKVTAVRSQNDLKPTISTLRSLSKVTPLVPILLLPKIPLRRLQLAMSHSLCWHVNGAPANPQQATEWHSHFWSCTQKRLRAPPATSRGLAFLPSVERCASRVGSHRSMLLPCPKITVPGRIKST